MPSDKKSSLKAYLPAVFKHVWFWVIGGLGGVLGVISLTTERLRVPLWIWLTAGGTVLTVAQFLAFHKERRSREELEEAAKPRLSIDFSTAPDEPFHFWQQKTEYPYELYRVKVTNRGAQTIRNVQLAISEIRPKPKEFFTVPFFLHPHRAEHNILDPGGELLFNVAIYHGHSPSKMIVGYELPLDVYTVRLTATGENAPPSHRRFTVHVYVGRLYMFPASEVLA
jgi:hypothetical protein